MSALSLGGRAHDDEGYFVGEHPLRGRDCRWVVDVAIVWGAEVPVSVGIAGVTQRLSCAGEVSAFAAGEGGDRGGVDCDVAVPPSTDVAGEVVDAGLDDGVGEPHESFVAFDLCGRVDVGAISRLRRSNSSSCAGGSRAGSRGPSAGPSSGSGFRRCGRSRPIRDGRVPREVRVRRVRLALQR